MNDSPDRERNTAQRTVMFGLLFLLLLIIAVILGYVFLGRPKAAPPPTLTSTAAAAPPAAPSNVTADIEAIFDVPVGWKDNSDNEDGFNIYRQRIDQASGKDKAGSTGKDATSFLDSGTVCGATYQYTIAAFNSAGESPTTPCWQVSLPACPAPANLTLKVGDKTLSPDVYLSADGTNLMADQPGQNGVLDLGDIGDTSLDKAHLPQPANYIKNGVAVSAGHTYAALMPDGKSVHVLTVNKVDSKMADTIGIIWTPGGATSGECTGQVPTQEVTTAPTESATQPCSPTANKDCVTPTVSQTPTSACECRGTTLYCPGQNPVANARQCSKSTQEATTPPPESTTPPACGPNSTDPACTGNKEKCSCDVENGAWNTHFTCVNPDTGAVLRTGVDASMCPAPVCGNGTVEGSEQCDSSNKGCHGGTCTSDCTCTDSATKPPKCTCIKLPNGGGYCKEDRSQKCTP